MIKKKRITASQRKGNYRRRSTFLPAVTCTPIIELFIHSLVSPYRTLQIYYLDEFNNVKGVGSMINDTDV